MSNSEENTVSYEEARRELDRIVIMLERGNMALDAVMENWERGEELVQYCQKYLNGARERIDARMKEVPEVEDTEDATVPF